MLENKENVHVEMEKAGDCAVAQEVATREDGKKENAPFARKFKSVDALEKAYESLQAEFTRKSQRLKELERLADNLENGDGNAERTVAEKLRSRSAEVKAEGQEFDRFVADLQGASAGDKQVSIAEEKPVEQENQMDSVDTVAKQDENETLSTTQGEVVGGEAKRQDERGTERQSFVAENRESVELTDDMLLQRVKENESVRLKIIGEYLTSVGKSVAPLMCGGAGTLAAPPIKAKTVQDAGNMALRWLKREHNQA